jgi:acetolactate synthase-1/2/3 large subunit
VLFVGNGIRFAGAEGELKRFAEISGIPVFCGGHGYGALPYDHPLWGKDLALLGVLGLMGQPSTDALLAVGARFGLFTGGRSEAIVPAGAAIAQVDLNPAEIGRLREVKVPVVADARETLRALADAAQRVEWPDWSAWAATACRLKAMTGAMFGPAPAEQSPIHPYYAMEVLAAAMPRDAIYVLDGGEASAWSHMVLKVDHCMQKIGAGYHGCLGVGPGMAIGAQTARPDLRVIQITGDGAMGFHIQEFDTQVRHRLPVVTVILNNQLWGMSAHGQDLVFGRGMRVISDLGGTRYADVARAFGCHAERVERLSDLSAALSRALNAGVPACVEVMTDPEVMHPAMPSMVGADNPAPNEIMIPYYDNIVLD